MKFNINKYVKVKLTPYGLSILEQQHKELEAQFPKIGPFKPPTVDADGWTKFQAWSLMQTFGPHISLGMDTPFETEIEIEE